MILLSLMASASASSPTPRIWRLRCLASGFLEVQVPIEYLFSFLFFLFESFGNSDSACSSLFCKNFGPLLSRLDPKAAPSGRIGLDLT